MCKYFKWYFVIIISIGNNECEGSKLKIFNFFPHTSKIMSLFFIHVRLSGPYEKTTIMHIQHKPLYCTPGISCKGATGQSSTNLNNDFQMRGVYLHRCAFIAFVLELCSWENHIHLSLISLQEPHLHSSIFLLRNTIPKTRRRNPRLHLLFLDAGWCPRLYPI